MDETSAESQGLDSYKIISGPGALIPKSHEGFVYAKWTRTLRHGNDLFYLIDPHAYYLQYSKYIERILLDPNCVVRFAVLSDDHDVVLGFSVSRLNVLDYVYVNRLRLASPTGFAIADYRKQGIGTKLIPQGIDTFTHITKTWLTIWNNKYKHWKFNPFA